MVDDSFHYTSADTSGEKWLLGEKNEPFYHSTEREEWLRDNLQTRMGSLDPLGIGWTTASRKDNGIKPCLSIEVNKQARNWQTEKGVSVMWKDMKVSTSGNTKFQFTYNNLNHFSWDACPIEIVMRDARIKSWQQVAM